MAANQPIHWRAPTAMVASLLTGALFALGHHLFYGSLSGRRVPVGLYNVAGIDVSLQQLNIAAGTGFAFLVKSSLVTAISLAYTQFAWMCAVSQEVRISTLDTIFAALGNALQLLHFRVWSSFRLLLLLAMIAWFAVSSSLALIRADE